MKRTAWAVAQLNPIVGDIEGNTEKALHAIREAKQKKVDLLIFPELFLIGYFPFDLLFEEDLLERVEKALHIVQKATFGIHVVIGTPLGPQDSMGRLFNGAVHFFDEKWMGVYKKQCLPFYDVFYEPRYFREGTDPYIFECEGSRVGLSICEDIFSFVPPWNALYDKDPLERMLGKVDLLVCLSSSPWHLGKSIAREEVIKEVSRRMKTPLLYVNQVGANDELLFDGGSVCTNDEGEISFRAPFWQEGLFSITQGTVALIEESLLEGLLMGIRDYFVKSRKSKAVLGLSGGIDSAVVASLLVLALGKENVTALLLPSRFTSSDNSEDAEKVRALLGLPHKKLSIEPLFHAILEEEGRVCDGRSGNLTVENIQARLRMLLLMSEANATDALLISTANKCEMSMGYSTLYGDMAGAIAPLGDLFKHEVYRVGRQLALKGIDLPERLFTKAPTAELCSNQKDEDSLPPYELLDPLLQKAILLKQAIPYEEREVLFRHEYKRKQAPLILRVSDKAFGKGRLFPIVHRFLG